MRLSWAGFRRFARAGAFPALLTATGLLPSAFALAQDAGVLRTAGESYHDTLPGESVNGLALDFRQLLPFGGLFSAEVVLVDKQSQTGIGRGVLRLSDFALGSTRVTAEGGDMTLKLDASPFHFVNDFAPVAYARGGTVRADDERATVSVFGGRNEEFEGIQLPTVVFAPESFVGGAASYRLTDRLVLDVNALRTTNQMPAENPLFGVPVPNNAQTYGSGGTLTLADNWTAQAKASYAQYEYAPDSPYRSGHFLSFVAGSVLDTDRWKAQGDYIRQGVNYIPLSTASVGNREGPEILVQSFGERLTAAASFSAYRNNLESNPDVPDLKSRSFFGSAVYRLTSSISATASYNQQSLSSVQNGVTSDFSQKTAASEVNMPTWGYTRLRYQFQTTDEPSSRQKLHEFGFEQQPPPIFGLNFVAGARFQLTDQGASSVLYRGGVSGSIGDVRLSFNGEFGNDLAASSVFALNRSQTVTAGISVPLPADIELRVEGYWNRVSAVVNPQSIFISQVTQEQLYSFNRRAILVRLARSFQWGRQPANGQDLGLGGAPLPYGSVEGFVFRDLNANGRRDAAEPGTEGVIVELDDGRTARTDQSGRFVFPNVIEGDHVVRLDLEVLPVSYNPPLDTAVRVHVQRLQPGTHDFGLIPTGSVSGRLEQILSSGARVGFAGVIVTLLPREFSTYTDDEGRFTFSNLPPGLYSVRLEGSSLPEGAVVETASSGELALAAGQDLVTEPLAFSLRVEEKPVQKIFEREQTVQPQSARRGKTGASTSSGAAKMSRSS